jgi:L-histidine N-alpha-methyltransferase
MTSTLEHSFHCRLGPAAVDIDAFARDINASLGADTKSIPSRHLYDARGLRLLEEVTRRADHYITRDEMDVLRAHADDVAAAAAPGLLLELGPLHTPRTRLLIDALLRRQRHLAYLPIDQCEAVLRPPAFALLREFSHLTVDAWADAADAALEAIFAGDPPPILLTVFAGRLSRLGHAHAPAFLARLRRRARPFDLLLLGTDLCRDPAALRRAHHDPDGANERFQKNLLRRLSRELGGHFRDEDFSYEVDLLEGGRGVRTRLRARRSMTVPVERLDRHFDFSEGETVDTGVIETFSVAELAPLTALAGWSELHEWRSADGKMAVAMLAPAAGRGIVSPA